MLIVMASSTELSFVVMWLLKHDASSWFSFSNDFARLFIFCQVIIMDVATMLCREHTLISRDVVGHFHNALPWSHPLSILATHPVVFRLCSLQLQWLCSESIDFNKNFFISLIKGEVNGESDEEALPLILDLNTDHVAWHASLVALGIDWS